MKFSVVIPTYNRADLIIESIDSILAQHTLPDEIIVVDDGSTDNTREVLNKYGIRVKLISVSNGGDLVARNIGLRAARNPLVAFCDSDDLWEPTFLSSMSDFWRIEPEMEVAYGNFRIVRDGQWAQETKFEAAPHGYWDELRFIGPYHGVFDTPSITRLLKFQPFFASAIVVSREKFYARGGWDEGVSRIVGTDFATALRMAEHPVGVLMQPLVGIRKHNSNFSGNTQRMNLGDAQVLEYVLSTRPWLEPYRPAILRSIAERRAAAADLAFDNRDFVSVREIQAYLGSEHLPLRRRLKGLISRLPKRVARAVANLFT